MQPVLYEIMKKAYTGIYIENKIKLVIYFNNTPPLYKTFENSFVVKFIFFSNNMHNVISSYKSFSVSFLYVTYLL